MGVAATISLHDDGIFDFGVRKCFAHTLLRELFDVKTVGPPAQNNGITAVGDLDHEISHAPTCAVSDTLCNNFGQRHGKRAHEHRVPWFAAHTLRISAQCVAAPTVKEVKSWLQMNPEQTPSQSFPPTLELLQLCGSRPLFGEELRTRLLAGARCVRFEFCISLLFLTIRRQSPVYLTHSWQERYLRGLWYSFLAILLGPWGVPWGLLWTPWAVWVNTTGGVDCTCEVLTWLDSIPTNSPAAQPSAQKEEVRSL